MALVACGSAWVAIDHTARALDVPFSSLLLWPGVLFGLAVATSYRFRLVLAVSLAALVVAVASAFFAAGGAPWTLVFERLEPLTGSAFVPAVAARHLDAAPDWVTQTVRLTGLAMGLGGLLVLSSVSGTSLFALTPPTALHAYQVVMLATGIGVLWGRLGAGDAAGVNLASLSLALFLLVRYADWFWAPLPAWVFFLGLAAGALLGILVLKRLRARVDSA
jgi:hypothetical protein